MHEGLGLCLACRRHNRSRKKEIPKEARLSPSRFSSACIISVKRGRIRGGGFPRALKAKSYAKCHLSAVDPQRSSTAIPFTAYNRGPWGINRTICPSFRRSSFALVDPLSILVHLLPSPFLPPSNRLSHHKSRYYDSAVDFPRDSERKPNLNSVHGWGGWRNHALGPSTGLRP